jgi:CheY-like chemotaxis protein
MLNTTTKLPANTTQKVLRIVYIEDNPLNAMVVRSILKTNRPDIQLTVCETGAAGMAQLRKEKADFLLVDLVLPDTNGVDLLKKIRENAQYVNTPAVATSSYPLPMEISKLLGAGFKQFLPKPIKAVDLLQTLKQLS